MSLLDELEVARRHPNVAAFGGAFGGIYPAGAYVLVHHELHTWLDARVVVVAACLAFSVTTVWQWTRGGTGSPWKATCAVVGLEGIMVFAQTTWLNLAALAQLVLINAIATACVLVSDKQRRVAAVAKELRLQPKPAARVPARVRA